MSDEPLILDVRDLHKSFPAPNGDLRVLVGLDFRPRRGRLSAILGASGAGKSTLLHILGTLDRLTSGTVLFEGRDVFRLSPRDLARFRNRSIGFVYQFHHLMPEFDALENVILPGLMSGRPRYQLEKEGAELLAAVGLLGRIQHRPSELSGGEQQRVAVARAIINGPALLLADEPSGNLDRENSEGLQDLLVRLVRERGQTTIVATHDERMTARADDVYRLDGGKLHLVSQLADNGVRTDNRQATRPLRPEHGP